MGWGVVSKYIWANKWFGHKEKLNAVSTSVEKLNAISTSVTLGKEESHSYQRASLCLIVHMAFAEETLLSWPGFHVSKTYISVGSCLEHSPSFDLFGAILNLKGEKGLTRELKLQISKIYHVQPSSFRWGKLSEARDRHELLPRPH